MDYKSLQHFLQLAESLHFSRASAACHISPSTLSRSIKQLEDEVGVPLFIRDNRSVILTNEGLRFQQFAKEVLSQWDSIKSSLQSEHQSLQGELSIYCSVTASYSFLYDILSQFRQDYPRIEIKLHTGDPATAIEHVQAGTEDIAIGARPDSLPQEIAFNSITLSPLVFIAPTAQPDWINDLNGMASPSAWRSTPMILSESGLARKRSDRWFKQLGIKPLIYAQVAGNEAIVSMVSLGFGVGIVPQIVLDNSPLSSEVMALNVSPALPEFEVGIFALEKKLRHPVVHAFWSQLNKN